MSIVINVIRAFNLILLFIMPPRIKFLKSKKRYNNNPHNVYLAYFSDEIVKVGTSHYKRTAKRLKEQGARSAIILQNCSNAYTARELEEYVVKNHLNIKEKVTASKKLSCLLKNSYNPNNAHNLLSSVKEEISKKRKDIINQESTILDFENSYFTSDFVFKGPIKDMSNSPPLIVQGKGMGIVGNVLILKNQDLVAFPLSKLLGRALKLI